MPNHRPLLLLIDGHALIYRAYHALPELTDPKGRLVNAVYGFTRILLNVIRQFQPDYIAVAFDSKEKTIRADIDETYKANRPEMPDNLKPQIELVRQVVDALNIPALILPGYEADDLIGTIAKRVTQERDDVDVLIVTGDKDLLQLVGDRVHVFIPKRGRFSRDIEYDPDQVKAKLGVLPSQVVDLKALMGDSSDNIKGVKGIGKKTAAKLINQFGSLKKLYQAIDAGTDGLSANIRQKLIDGRADAFLSQELAQIQLKVPVKFDLERARVTHYDKEKVVNLFEELGFHSLKKYLPQDEFEKSVQEALF